MAACRARSRVGAPTRIGAVVAASMLLAAGGASGQATITPTLSGRVEYTNNLYLTSGDQRSDSFVFQLTPGLAVDYRAPRASLQGVVAVPLVYYTVGSSSADVRAMLRGSAEVLRDFFFVDASVDVTQTYFDPFGARPDNITSITDNRYTAATYRLVPYIKGRIGDRYSYLLRDQLIWNSFYDSPRDVGTTYSNRLFGTFERDAEPFGWGVDLYRDEYELDQARARQLLERVRGRATWQPSPLLFLFASGGYERNRFPLTSYEGPTYGAGVRWQPGSRTVLDAEWEHRFFGDSYRVNFNHRTRLTVWSLRASRDASSYPELLAQVPEGTFVPGLLNDLLTARIPDPEERARFIVDFMSSRGLPVVLEAPLELYSSRITVVERAVGTVGLLGARSTVFLSAFYSERTPVTASGTEIPPVLNRPTDNNTQTGGSAVYDYRIGPLSSLSLSGSLSRTEANAPATGESTQRTVRLSFTRTLSPLTNIFAGARYTDYDSNFGAPWDEFAVFAGFNYRFR